MTIKTKKNQSNNFIKIKSILTFNHSVPYFVVKVQPKHCQVSNNVINGCICLDDREKTHETS